ncbi:hypothetical protein GLAREA_02295 [Glarea lozoyensis ATCC 20868]|uniref:Berberine/berberine-like domain-containing protein n=1 Tax=Glarea lozoyensis (strain ATCC 20868 / MF5171) TaxID=1116229 RepID=S3DIK6_GLAL2|nr:uncharacterized protein GLAREA_02295 [Glarea lozoyensis ATCC 20868]EPE26383.1 hypothetical protein GLAREA_02295 [Glarea lozoyensis ATCC 20868]
MDVSMYDASKAFANPYWRKTTVLSALGTYFNYQDYDSNQVNQDLMTKVLTPQLASLAPDGGAYLNEVDFQQPDWKYVFYGRHYNKLNIIKSNYDPNDLFYALGAVGSDRWKQILDGRLCRVWNTNVMKLYLQSCT